MSLKPKLSIERVINKSFIVWGINKNNNLQIYYKWNITSDEYEEMQKLDEFLVVDYDKKKREWYTTYINNGNILSCTIDDITSAYSIAKF